MVESATFDRIKRAFVTHTWLEVGFKFISDTSWTSITTHNKDWVGNVVVFVSLPSFGGSHFTQGKMLAPKMSQLARRNADNTYTFSVMFVQANDSFCNKTWSIPTPLGETQMSWIAVEEGAYYIQNHTFIIGSGNISRVDNSGSATVANGNAVKLDYPIGCEGDFSLPCAPSEITNQLNLGALQQLQTSVNTIDNGHNLFLSVRTRVVNLRSIQLVMFPHSATVPSYYALTTPEIVAYFVFSAFNFVCAENMVFETHIYEGVTSSPIKVTYFNSFDYVPGLFGTLGSTVSLGDATTIRSFNSSVNGSNFITQEDQCVDEQTDHTTPERVFTFVIGEVSKSVSNFTCNVIFNSAKFTDFPTGDPSTPPTASPSKLPTSTPTKIPTSTPTSSPTRTPTVAPTVFATAKPTVSCGGNQFEVKFTKTARKKR